MPSLNQYVPDGDDVLRMEPEELAGYLLESLNSQGAATFALMNIGLGLANMYPSYGRISELQKAVMEALGWLIAENLIAPAYNQMGWYTVSRRGSQLKVHSDVEDLRRRNLLPKAFLHPTLAQNAYPIFMSGHYDAAVFQAFKDVEIAIREVSGLTESDGVALAREAFRPANPRDARAVQAGPLVDVSLKESEQQAMMNLFAGALGWCRNPVGHKNVGLKAQEAAELITFATYLFRLVDRARERIAPPER